MRLLFKIENPGPYTTIQDQGRYGYQRFGIPITGALDDFASKIANLLVGNDENRAVLEFTYFGAQMHLLDDAVLAVTGADMPVTLNGKPVQRWTSFNARKNSILHIGQTEAGCRGYLAVSGGIEVPVVMGSRSCYTGAKIGGLHGRRLQEGDLLLRCEGASAGPRVSLPKALIPRYPSRIVLRAIPGPQDDFFDQGLDLFFASEFTVTPHADRMGYRLQGPKIVQRDGTPQSIISEPSLPGGVQIPQDGQPIVLLVEQTVGGYSKIATVISSDITKVAQAVPGDRIRFERVDVNTAYDIKAENQGVFDALKSQLSADACSCPPDDLPPASGTTDDPEHFARLVYRYLCQI